MNISHISIESRKARKPTCIAEVDYHLKSTWMDLLELDGGRPGLQQVLGEHGLEVGRGRRQEKTVGRDLSAICSTGKSGQVSSGHGRA